MKSVCMDALTTPPMWECVAKGATRLLTMSSAMVKTSPSMAEDVDEMKCE